MSLLTLIRNRDLAGIQAFLNNPEHTGLLTNMTDNEAKEILSNSIFLSDAVTFESVLNIPVVRDNAHANNNQVLRLAAQNGRFGIVDKLLGTKAVRD